MSAFDKMKLGLDEAIAYERGEISAKTTSISIMSINQTVEAWESGRNHPEGAACRLLKLTKDDPLFPVTTGIVVR